MQKGALQVFIDLVSSLILLIIYTLTTFLSFYILDITTIQQVIQSIDWQPLSLTLLIVIYIFVWIMILPLIIYVIRRSLPQLKEGTYGIPSGMFLVWGINIILNRLIWVIPIRYLIFSSSFLRYIYLRSYGCKTAYSIQTSISISMTDYPLITIEKGAFIGDEAVISAHLVINGKLRLHAVHIGKGSLIYAAAFIGPGSKLGENSIVGFHGVVYKSKLGYRSQVRGLSVALGVNVPDGKKHEWLPENPKGKEGEKSKDISTLSEGQNQDSIL